MTHPPWVVPYLRAIVFGGEKPYTLSCLNSTLNSHVEHICHALELYVKSHPDVGRKGKKKYSVISIQISWQCSKLPYMHYDENSFRSFAFFCSCCPPWLLLLLRMSHSIVFWQKDQRSRYLVIFPWIRLSIYLSRHHLLSLTRSIFWPKLKKSKYMWRLKNVTAHFLIVFWNNY